MTQRAHREPLFVFVFVGDVDEEGHNGGMPLHQLYHEVEAQMHTLTDQALMPRSTAADQPIQRLHHHFTLCFITLRHAAICSAWCQRQDTKRYSGNSDCRRGSHALHSCSSADVRLP